MVTSGGAGVPWARFAAWMKLLEPIGALLGTGRSSSATWWPFHATALRNVSNVGMDRPAARTTLLCSTIIL